MAFSVSMKPAGIKNTCRKAVVARAEGEAVAKVDRSKDQLIFPTDQSLSYLDGSLPGDFGFDPLGLSDPEGAGGFISPEWLQYGEIMNGRYAMLGAAGIMVPEILGNMGVIPEATQMLWFKTGVIPPVGQTDTFWMDPYALFWIEVVLMQFAELRRWGDYRNPGSMSKQYFMGIESAFEGTGEPAYPGGAIFNFAGMAKEGPAKKELRLKEIKNGRLAMLACFGFGSQAIITGKGPIENFTDHIADPTGANLLTNLSTFLR